MKVLVAKMQNMARIAVGLAHACKRPMEITTMTQVGQRSERMPARDSTGAGSQPGHCSPTQACPPTDAPSLCRHPPSCSAAEVLSPAVAEPGAATHLGMLYRRLGDRVYHLFQMQALNAVSTDDGAGAASCGRGRSGRPRDEPPSSYPLASSPRSLTHRRRWSPVLRRRTRAPRSSSKTRRRIPGANCPR